MKKQNMKKFTALAAAAVLAACAVAPSVGSLPAWATTEAVTNGSIVIKDSKVNHTYSAYQIFDGDLAKDSESGEVIFSNVKWGSGIKTTEGTPDSVNKTIYDALKDLSIYVIKDSTTGEISISTSGTDGAYNLFANNNAALTSAAEVAEAMTSLSSNTTKGTDSVLTGNAGRTEIDRVAEVFQKYLSSSATATGSASIAGDCTILIEDPGYYLVVDSVTTGNALGTKDALSKYMLLVADTVNINPKSSAPEVIKKVKENSKTTTDYSGTKSALQSTVDNESKWNDVADYNMGDSVPFKLYGSLPSTYADYKQYYYKFTDSFSSGLTLDVTGGSRASALDAGDFTVQVGNQSDGNWTWSTVDTTCYTVNAVETSGTTTGFTLEFSNLKASNAVTSGSSAVSLTKDSIITVEYKATLNQSANVGLDGNTNEVYLTYSSNPNQESGGTTETNNTPEDEVIVFTYELDVKKYLGSTSTTANATSGTQAGFKLTRKNDEKTEYAVVDENSNKVTGWTETAASGTEVKTDSNGIFKFIGLDDGEYTLIETTVPTGYNKMADQTMVIKANTQNNQAWDDFAASNALKTEEAAGGTITMNAVQLFHSTSDITNQDKGSSYDSSNITDNGTSGTVYDTIINESGSTLPSTGGIGTTIFYVAGGVLVVGAGVLLITKKRAKDEA